MDTGMKVVHTSVEKDNRGKLDSFQENALAALIDYIHLKSYSANTLKSYVSNFTLFLLAFPGIKPSSISKQQILDYLLREQREKKWSESHQNGVINSIKFFYETVCGRKKEYYDIPRPKRPEKNPNVISKQEVKAIFENVSNIKHKSMLMMAYAGGLRVSEITGLEIRDIDSSRMLVHIRGAKGKKDRQVPLSQILLDILREYFIIKKPKKWLFEGNKGGRYSERGIQEIIKEAKKKAKIKRPVTMHTLRHSFATHLLEGGTDIRYIQDLLGHKSIRTTMIYTHVSKKDIGKIRSPLDDLDL